ncbi:hypothetical protein GGTG_12322 [Gaeumannomyces tritici R3-111a-1]|uniref:Uncharacterized protein n=1 Tax=Gaeumannomyces tritici (strain R3-111a-1) TaxID=644352 RepID=J3PFP7_GAET3|nr:hypothetical protein GGTG_12322 [Gaeumannomyces tritici R3-111a-1]EJT70149.1 hypothetical protein GGTG_12322 [Gaeumannomyces tritici R3-111a-1]
MRFSATFFLGLVAYAAALPTVTLTGDVIEARAPQLSVPPGTPVTDTQGVKLRPGTRCTTTSTEGVLACNDGTGAVFNIVKGRIRGRDLVPPEEDSGDAAAQEAADDREEEDD